MSVFLYYYHFYINYFINPKGNNFVIQLKNLSKFTDEWGYDTDVEDETELVYFL